ncbi:MAG: hypothetical protein HY289_08075 [Planctomycetes bacterium]|nr:hypothetical protein [Planctomycetota bacterium]
MNKKTVYIAVIVGVASVGLCLLGIGATAAFVWPGFLRTKQADQAKQDDPAIKKPTDDKPAAKPVPADIGALLILARDRVAVENKERGFETWGNDMLVDTAALQTLLAIKTKDSKQIDEAKKTADVCTKTGAKADAYYLIAVAQARMGDVALGKKTFETAESIEPAKSVKARFEAHFAAGLNDRSWFDRAHKTSREHWDDAHKMQIVKIQARCAVRTRNKAHLEDATKAAERFFIYKPKALAQIAGAYVEIGAKDAGMALFAEARKEAKQSGLWDVIEILADTAVAARDDALLQMAEALIADLDPERGNVSDIGYRSVAVATARRASATGAHQRFELALKLAEKAKEPSDYNFALAGIIAAQADAAVTAKNVELLAQARQSAAKFRSGNDFHESIAMSTIAAAEIRLAFKLGDATLRAKGIATARVSDTDLQNAAAALAETGFLAEHTQLSKNPSTVIYLGLAEGLMRQKGWWSEEELACTSPGRHWRFN